MLTLHIVVHSVAPPVRAWRVAYSVPALDRIGVGLFYGMIKLECGEGFSELVRLVTSDNHTASIVGRGVVSTRDRERVNGMREGGLANRWRGKC